MAATSSTDAECLSTKPDAPASSARRAKVDVPVHGEKHHRRSISTLPQLDQSVDAVEVGHGDVGDDHVRPQRPGRLDQRAPVLHHAHQVELGSQQTLQRLGHQQVVVGEEHPRTTLGAHGGLLSDGNPGDDRRAPAGRALDVERAVHQPHPFAHARQAEAPSSLRLRRIEADAVVADGKEQTVVHLPQGDVSGARTGVAGHVVQRLLRHAEQAERRLFPDDAGSGSDLQREFERAPAALPFALRPQRLGEAELVQDRRVQLVGQGVDVLAEAHEPLAKRSHRLCLRSVGSGELGAADLDRQHGDPLRQVVVQLAREQRALLLVGADQTPAQVVQLAPRSACAR